PAPSGMPLLFATIAKLVKRSARLTAKSERSDTWNSYNRIPLVAVDVPFLTTSVGRYEPAAAPSAGASGVGAVIAAAEAGVAFGLSGALLLLQAARPAAPAAAMNTREAFTNDAPDEGGRECTTSYVGSRISQQKICLMLIITQ